MKQTIATTPEQYARLKSCGVDPKSADMYWQVPITVSQLKSGEHILLVRRKGQICLATDIPAWSTSRLLSLLLKEINDKGLQTTFQLVAMNKKMWRADYYDYAMDKYLCSYCTSNIIETIVNIIEWLTSEGYKLNEIEE